MPLTLGLTGMDPATEAELTAAFAEANARLGEPWQLVPEGAADHIVVDMDSMYGPMSWLRLHAAGKHVIGLTAAARTQTDYSLTRPVDGHQVERVLAAVAHRAGVDAVAAAADAGAPGADDVRADARRGGDAAPGKDTEPAPLASKDAHVDQGPVPAGLTQAPAPQDQLPEEMAGNASEAVSVPEPEPVAAAVEPPARPPVFVDWLAPGALPGRARYRRDGGARLLVDPVAHTWHGPAALKEVASAIRGEVHGDAFEAIDDAAWDTESAAAGAAQPLSRLLWLASLVAGDGQLLPGLDPAGRYTLNKWPQTEREFPKHFRIATAMMKGPATVDEIAQASAMPAADVADFINASLATGYAEAVPEVAEAPAPPPKPAGLLGRLRGR
jgi:hypothetical protein